MLSFLTNGRLTGGTLIVRDLASQPVVPPNPDSSYRLERDVLDRLIRIDNQDAPTVPRVVLGSPLLCCPREN